MYGYQYGYGYSGGGGGGGRVRLATPDGLDWPDMPLRIYSDGSTSFSKADWEINAEVDIWVSTTGNDTTGTGSIGAPYATIKKALTEAGLKAETSINIFVWAGEYPYNQHFSNTAVNKNINAIAVGGRVTCTNKFPLASSVLDGTGCYRFTRSGIQDVRDWRYPVTWPNGEQTPMLLAQVSELALCQALPGTWYTNGTSVWVHLMDGRVPDAGPGGDVGLLYGAPSLLMTHNRRMFLDGFDFESANTSVIKVQPAAGAAGVERLVTHDCSIRFQRVAGSNSVQMHSLQLGINYNLRSYEAEGDAYNYSTVNLSNSPSTKAIEIGCHAYKCGRPATHGGIINGSTNHGDGRVIRVGGVYRDTYGPVCADINTSRNWYVGCDMQGSLMDDDSSQDAAMQTLNTARSWLDRCKLGGAHHAMYAGGSSQIRHRNCSIEGQIFGDVAAY